MSLTSRSPRLATLCAGTCAQLLLSIINGGSDLYDCVDTQVCTYSKARELALKFTHTHTQVKNTRYTCVEHKSVRTGWFINIWNVIKAKKTSALTTFVDIYSTWEVARATVPLKPTPCWHPLSHTCSNPGAAHPHLRNSPGAAKGYRDLLLW